MSWSGNSAEDLLRSRSCCKGLSEGMGGVFVHQSAKLSLVEYVTAASMHPPGAHADGRAEVG